MGLHGGFEKQHWQSPRVLVVMTGVYELAKVLELRSQDCVAAVYSGSDSSVGRLRFYAAAWHRPRE